MVQKVNHLVKTASIHTSHVMIRVIINLSLGLMALLWSSGDKEDAGCELPLHCHYPLTPLPYLTGRLSGKNVPSSPFCDKVSHLTAFHEAELQDEKELRRNLDMTPHSHETSPTSIIHTDSFYLGVLKGVGGSSSSLP